MPSTWLPLASVPAGEDPGDVAALHDLVHAIQEGKVAAVELLLDRGVDLDLSLPLAGGPSPSMLAASLARPQVLALLLQRGAVCRYREAETTGLLALASCPGGEAGDEVACGELLLVAGEDLEIAGRGGFNALMAAARGGKAELVGWLCDRGAGLDRRDSQGWSALMFSVDSGQGHVARMLVERGADLGLVSTDGQRAVDIAAAAGLATLQEVLEHLGGGKGIGEVVRHDREVEVRCSQVESVLLGLDLGKHSEAFREAEVGLEELLLLREEELESLGLVRLGERKRLMQALAEMHKTDWQRGSLPRLQQDARREGLMVSAVDAASMLANLVQHARLMRANLAYIRLQTRDHGPRLLEVGGDLVPPHQLLHHAEEVSVALTLLRQEARGLARELLKVAGSQGRGGQKIWGGLLLLGVGMVALAIVRKLQ